MPLLKPGLWSWSASAVEHRFKSLAQRMTMLIDVPHVAVFGADIVFTWFAAAIAGAVVSFPLMARSIMVAMSGVDRRLELSARTLGAGPWRVFLTITVPLAYKGILAGLLLGFVRAQGEFGATIVVAGNISGRTETLALAVYSRILLGRDGDAFRLIGITIALAVVTLAAHNWLLARSGRREVIG